MTETTGATCPTCTSVLPAGGVPCPRCAAPPAAASTGPQSGHHGVPQQYAPPQYPSAPYPSPQYAPYQGMPYQPMPYQGGAYPGTPQPPAAYAGAPYPPAPYPAAGYAPRPAKSAGIAVLLTLLWIGAGHLYLDRIGTGLALMGAHLVFGLLLLFVFPVGFLVWLIAVIVCCIACSNLAGQINAGTVPPRETW